MIRSMTGYGRGEAAISGGSWVVEVKSVNHRFLDVRTKLPSDLFALDLQVNRMLQDRFSRGRFEVLFNREASGSRRNAVNREALAQYLQDLRALGAELKIPGEVTLDTLLKLPDVIQDSAPRMGEEAHATLLEALGQALTALQQMREQEGKAVSADLRERMERILKVSKTIDGQVPALNKALHARLIGRLEELVAGVALDAGRVEQEVAFLIERSDVTEELVRLGIHVRQFIAYLDESEPVGRKLDFLIQEINREVNTLGSKIGDAEVAQLVVNMKSELEKVREQVQNVE
jgi:uncharacterized protein (TIGR00255 family)